MLIKILDQDAEIFEERQATYMYMSRRLLNSSDQVNIPATLNEALSHKLNYKYTRRMEPNKLLMLSSSRLDVKQVYLFIRQEDTIVLMDFLYPTLLYDNSFLNYILHFTYILLKP